MLERFMCREESLSLSFAIINLQSDRVICNFILALSSYEKQYHFNDARFKELARLFLNMIMANLPYEMISKRV